MSSDWFTTFTDRREEIALFELLRGRNPNKPWPLLPILAFVAPGGSGKSTLLRYLREVKCSVGNRPALPYAYLDFTLPHAPKDVLSILIALRDQLQGQGDADGKHFVFPRFDLGAFIVQPTSSQQDVASLGPTQIRQRLTTGVQVIKSLSDLGSSLGYALPYAAPLFAGLQLAGQIKPLKELLSYFEESTGWKWYRSHGTETRLGSNAALKEVLLRLYMMSMPGKPEKDFLIHHLLPAAFLDDLFDALLASAQPHPWSKTANIVLFLDGYEALQRAPDKTALRLLQMLTVT